MELESPGWYCVRTRQKQEHIAAGNLRALGIEVFCPRLRLRRGTRRGPVWFLEALFPGYLIARFALRAFLRDVSGAGGVATVVEFGGTHPSVPEEVIGELRAMIGDSEVISQDQTVAPGERIEVAAGPFQGLIGIATQVLPAAERVRVLLEILGRATEVELSASAVVHADVRAWKVAVAGNRI